MAVKPSVTVLAAAGLNARAAEATTVVKPLPSALACTDSVWVRASQAAGSFSTTWSTARLVPRSTCAHWGSAPLLSQ